jgi:hypothetical protein
MGRFLYGFSDGVPSRASAFRAVSRARHERVSGCSAVRSHLLTDSTPATKPLLFVHQLRSSCRECTDPPGANWSPQPGGEQAAKPSPSNSNVPGDRVVICTGNSSDPIVKKKAAVFLAAAVAALGIATAVYALSDQPEHTARTAPAAHEQGQIQAPPHPPRAKPVERVVVSK